VTTEVEARIAPNVMDDVLGQLVLNHGLNDKLKALVATTMATDVQLAVAFSEAGREFSKEGKTSISASLLTIAANLMCPSSPNPVRVEKFVVSISIESDALMRFRLTGEAMGDLKVGTTPDKPGHLVRFDFAQIYKYLPETATSRIVREAATVIAG